MMNSIEVYFDKKFIKEKNKFKRICPSIESDFNRFLTSLKIQIQENDYRVPVDNENIYRISGLDRSVTLPAFIVKSFYCEKLNRGKKSGFRITFIYDFKKHKEIEDKNRINKLFKKS